MGSYFDPTGIFMDGTLFTDDAQTVFCRYGARPAYAGEANRKLVGDPDRPYIYIVEGLSVGGYPASLGFSWNSEYPWNAYYEIDLLGQSSEAVYELVNEVLSEIEGTPGIELSYAGVDAAALPLSYFDENSPQDSHGGKSFTYSYALNRANVTYRISVLYYRNAAYMRGSDTDGYIVPALHGITIHVSRWVLK
jgi:hypothetical protein